MELDVVRIDKPDDMNVIVGQAHFIKTIEDVHEALVGVSPQLRFGVAFCEASAPASYADPATTNASSTWRPRTPLPWGRVTPSSCFSRTVTP